jgi:hypothetical protein
VYPSEGRCVLSPDDGLNGGTEAINAPLQPAVPGKLDPRCGVPDPAFGHELLAVPTALVDEKLPEVGHVARAKPDPECAVADLIRNVSTAGVGQ